MRIKIETTVVKSFSEDRALMQTSRRIIQLPEFIFFV